MQIDIDASMLSIRYPAEVNLHGDAAETLRLLLPLLQPKSDRAWRERVPEFRAAYLIYSGPSVGVRETRRIVGDYQLTEDDIRTSRRFDDAVLKGVFYVDIHPADRAGTHDYDAWTPEPYDIPFRTLLPRGWDDLLVAGRCHSATRRAAGSSRVTATAMAMGQAAGTAAALAVASDTRVRDLDTNALQNALRAAGVILD